ncbi:hypothetical protein SEEM1594_24610, partial [Salmonella enterica subsp. enterica serovar Muenchen str. baa1594]
QTAVLWLAERFIPAGAGNTFITHPVITRTPVYPRWRGEHTNIAATLIGSIGLSPLARGTRKRAHFPLRGLRFIPAGAGNTCATTSSNRSQAVYPRWRGEHRYAVRENILRTGLSPLARGTLVEADEIVVSIRFIPAGAGNTAPGNRLNPVLPVYPRWRGEHVLRGWIVNAANGLSPLARGTH